MTSLYLVRHAKAGDRSAWDGDDLLRPLSRRGEAQARAVCDLLRTAGVTRFVSSPFVRCRQTLKPLAKELGTKVLDDERLAEGADVDETLELLATADDATALCSHGDVIPEVIAAIERRGCRIETQPDWRKATVWVIERNGDDWVRATVWPPPT